VVVKGCEVVADVVDVADVLLVAVEELVTVNIAEAESRPGLPRTVIVKVPAGAVLLTVKVALGEPLVHIDKDEVRPDGLIRMLQLVSVGLKPVAVT
jgi:hypothetical protein